MVTQAKNQVDALAGMTATELRQKHIEVFGEPSRSSNAEFLRKRLAWRIQSLAEGGLSERAKQRATELARDADVRITVPRGMKAAPASKSQRLPIPGSILTRQFRGREIRVTVLDTGFEYDGQVYRSLSAVAKAVTGSHWNGFLFFGLNGDKA